VESSTVQTERTRTTLPDHVKGGELMLKLFAFTQAFAASTVDALRRREEGQTMAEYGVVLAVITIGIVVALTALAGGINGALTKVTGKL
jgi:Flp pilus assembly pilin Flp